MASAVDWLRLRSTTSMARGRRDFGDPRAP